MNNEILFISGDESEKELYNIDSLMNSISSKPMQTISIIDADNPEESQLYTYNKFLEIFDTNGLDGFIV